MATIAFCRVPDTYLDSVKAAFLEYLALLKINNLRIINWLLPFESLFLRQIISVKINNIYMAFMPRSYAAQ